MMGWAMAVGLAWSVSAQEATSPVKPLHKQGETRSKAYTERMDLTKGNAGEPASFPKEFRTIDGSGNNLANPEWGSADIEFLRLSSVGYGDGANTPSGEDRPSARFVSNLCVEGPNELPNNWGMSDMFWQWGQFLDHDIDLAGTMDPVEPMDIAVPAGDVFFDPNGDGDKVIHLERSFYRMVDGVRQQVNDITAYIDASNVYGSDPVRAAFLRTNDGTGKLKTSEGNLLPFNTDELPNAHSTSPTMFIAGDVRVNEQIYLTAMHTLWMREHNFWANLLGLALRGADGDTIYEYAKAIVTAEIQSITFNEFLPILLGEDGIAEYEGYNPGINAGISNEFATACYRFGHTMLSSELRRLGRGFRPIPEGNVALASAFFNSTAPLQELGIEPYLRGLIGHAAQELDNVIVTDVRNFLFGPPGAGGFDLASLNIQRGRDHGLPDYNTVRADFGLDPVTSFDDISSNPAVVQRLSETYDDVNDLDLWVAGLAEDKYPGAVVGETFFAVFKDQFEALRDGDRFWYESYLPRPLVRMVENQSLSRVIRRNTSIGFFEMPRDPFHVKD